MKLDLNNKEYVALYGLLERQSASLDKHLVEVYSRMKAHFVALLASADRDVFERWAESTQRKIDDLQQENSQLMKPQGLELVLTDNDDEFQVRPQEDYPKKTSRHRRDRNRGRKG